LILALLANGTQEIVWNLDTQLWAVVSKEWLRLDEEYLEMEPHRCAAGNSCERGAENAGE